MSGKPNPKQLDITDPRLVKVLSDFEMIHSAENAKLLVINLPGMLPKDWSEIKDYLVPQMDINFRNLFHGTLTRWKARHPNFANSATLKRVLTSMGAVRLAEDIPKLQEDAWKEWANQTSALLAADSNTIASEACWLELMEKLDLKSDIPDLKPVAMPNYSAFWLKALSVYRARNRADVDLVRELKKVILNELKCPQLYNEVNKILLDDVKPGGKK